jgi:hypothetical protein
MDAVFSMTKSKNIMRISSWIKGFLVVRLGEEFPWMARVWGAAATVLLIAGGGR